MHCTERRFLECLRKSGVCKSISLASNPEQPNLLHQEDQVGARILLSHRYDLRDELLDDSMVRRETSVEQADEVAEHDAILRYSGPDLIESHRHYIQGHRARSSTPRTNAHDDPVVYVQSGAGSSGSDVLASERDIGLGARSRDVAIGVLHSRGLLRSDLREDQLGDRILCSQRLEVDQESIVALTSDAREEQLEELGKHDAVVWDGGSHLHEGRRDEMLRQQDARPAGDACSGTDENAVVGILGGTSGGGGDALPCVRGDRGMVGAEGVLHGESGDDELGCVVRVGRRRSVERQTKCVIDVEGGSDEERN